MSSVNERIALTLEEALDTLEFALDAASVDYQTCDTPNVNQYSLIFAEGTRIAYITAEESWDGEPAVFVDIYIVGADGTEHWVCGDMSVDAAVSYIAEA
jgi:hypothetical protein|nr:MAG TPA: hypothetical protein [Caudoviricetes sp.]